MPRRFRRGHDERLLRVTTETGHEPPFANVCNQAAGPNASMTEIELEQEFWRLCQVVDEADTPESSVPDLEPHLLAILNLAKENLDQRGLLVRCFVSLVDGSRVLSNWIVLFCMRELRWPEVRDAANLRFERAGGVRAPRLMNWISHINWVYDDAPWEDADFFQYFWQQEHPGEAWPCAKPPETGN